jgi:hypothetical protein
MRRMCVSGGPRVLGLEGSARRLQREVSMNEREQHLDPSAVRRLWLARPRTAAPSRRRRIARPASREQPPALEMLYAADDLVVPTDLPRAFVCRVALAHHVEGTVLQVLELEPFDGPWPAETRLIRGSDSVRPATSSELWSMRTTPKALALDRRVRPHRHSAPPERRSRRPVGPTPSGIA